MPELARNLDDHEGRRVNTLRGVDKGNDRQAENEARFEASRIREDVLKRMTQEKGVISESEEGEWKDKLMDAKEDVQRLGRIKEAYEKNMMESAKEHERFDTKVHRAEDEGWLEDGEHERLDRRFNQSRLDEKRALGIEFDKELEKRQHEIKEALADIDGRIVKKHEKSIKEAKNWKDKQKEARETAEHAEGLEDYLKKVGAFPVGEKTVREFREWYIEQGKDMRKQAPRLLDKVMAPYVETWEAHGKLPKQHQAPEFKEMGRRERERWLARKERETDQAHDRLLHDKGKKYFSEKEMDEAERTFARRENDTGARLARKIEFLEALPGHIEAAKKLHDQFEKFAPEIQLMYKKEFRKMDYDDKKKLLENTIPKESKLYLDQRRRMGELDKNVYDLYQDRFEDAADLREKARVVKEAEKFQGLFDKHQDLRAAHADLFNSPPERSRERYVREVHTLDEAQNAYRDLRQEIRERTVVHDGIEKLPKFLADRIELNAPFGQIKDRYDEIREIEKAYHVAIPFMMQTAKKAEAEGNEPGALNAYMAALKLDPESKEIQKLVAHLVQKGVTPAEEAERMPDNKDQETVLEAVRTMPDIDQETYELAREQIFLDMAVQHKQHVGATAGTVEARRRAALKVMSADDAKATQELEEAHLMDEDWTVDETGRLRKIETIKVGQTQLEKTEDSLEEKLDTKFHKGEAAKTGTAETKFVDRSGAEVELHTVQKRLDEQGEQVEANVIELATALLQRDHGFTKKQAKAFQEEMKLAGASRAASVEEQKKRLAA